LFHRKFTISDERANARHVPTRPKPNYRNQLTHARRYSLKSAALGVGHHAVVSLPFEWQGYVDNKTTNSHYHKNWILAMSFLPSEDE
jgi:hypothetical protein